MQITYPPTQFSTRVVKNKQQIFCTLRKRWLVLSPEEWVRQHFIAYLVQSMRYPATLIAAEKELTVNGLKKRFDILVYDAQHKPWMLVECKEEGVALSENVLQQVLRYNIAVPVQYLVITNGKLTLAWHRTDAGLAILAELPAWQQ